MQGISQIASPIPLPPPRYWLVIFLMHTLLWGVWWSSEDNAQGLAAENASRSDSWLPPLSGATEAHVDRPFVAPEMPWSAAHRGVDLLTGSVEVLAPAPGEVTFVGTVVDRPVVTIRHPDGLLSSFEPVESDLQVGQTVSQGQTIGNISAEHHHCASTCLHWGVRKPDAWHIGSAVRDLYIDPAFLLGWTEPSVLWPIHSDPAP